MAAMRKSAQNVQRFMDAVNRKASAQEAQKGERCPRRGPRCRQDPPGRAGSKLPVPFKPL